MALQHLPYVASQAALGLLLSSLVHIFPFPLTQVRSGHVHILMFALHFRTEKLCTSGRPAHPCRDWCQARVSPYGSYPNSSWRKYFITTETFTICNHRFFHYIPCELSTDITEVVFLCELQISHGYFGSRLGSLLGCFLLRAHVSAGRCIGTTQVQVGIGLGKINDPAGACQ